MTFVVREASVKVLREHSFALFKERLRNFLIGLDSERWRALENSQPGSLDRLVTSGIEKANRFGITTERDLALFLAIVARYGIDFEQSFPRARPILEHPRMGGGIKVRKIMDGLREGTL
jgi:hypothetical protein